MTHAQGDAVNIQASLNDALPTIQAQMEILLKSTQDYFLSPEQPDYYIQITVDSVIVADMVKDFPLKTMGTILLRHFQRVTDQLPRPLTEKAWDLQKAENFWWDENSRSTRKVWSILQNILDLFKINTALETTYSDHEIRLAMRQDLSPEALTAVLNSHFDSKTPTEIPIVIPGLSPMPSPEPEPSTITIDVISDTPNNMPSPAPEPLTITIDVIECKVFCTDKESNASQALVPFRMFLGLLTWWCTTTTA